jgi:hypothetical protein
MTSFPGSEMVGFPAAWTVCDEERGWVVAEIRNLMRDPGDGTVLEASNLTILRYAGDGRWAEEEDVYNPATFLDLATRYVRHAPGSEPCPTTGAHGRRGSWSTWTAEHGQVRSGSSDPRPRRETYCTPPGEREERGEHRDAGVEGDVLPVHHPVRPEHVEPGAEPQDGGPGGAQAALRRDRADDEWKGEQQREEQRVDPAEQPDELAEHGGGGKRSEETGHEDLLVSM